MKILMVHNEYGRLSGEEIVVNGVRRLLGEHGHKVISFIRSSAEIETMRWGKARAFFSGIYSRSSRLMMRRLLAKDRPDVVHIHNLFSLISPSILPECRRASVPVVMTVHNYRLVCPNGLHIVRGQVCEKCCGGREWWCVLRNCEGSFPKSFGYALRNYVARKRRFFVDNVTTFAVLTEFQRQRLISEGFPAERIAVIPNMAGKDGPLADEMLGNPGHFVGYVGRISQEKGIRTLLAVARKCPKIPFRAAGGHNGKQQMHMQAPANFQSMGYLDPQSTAEFYDSARIIVLCSVCFEGFPMAIVEAMIHGKPVICSRIGGLPEIVEDGKTGLLFEPGNAVELAKKIRYLWDRPQLCRKMGQVAREKALRENSATKHYERLMAVYRRATELAAGVWQGSTREGSEKDI